MEQNILEYRRIVNDNNKKVLEYMLPFHVFCEVKQYFIRKTTVGREKHFLPRLKSKKGPRKCILVIRKIADFASKVLMVKETAIGL